VQVAPSSVSRVFENIWDAERAVAKSFNQLEPLSKCTGPDMASEED
jgi:hypothetical protein